MFFKFQSENKIFHYNYRMDKYKHLATTLSHREFMKMVQEKSEEHERHMKESKQFVKAFKKSSKRNLEEIKIMTKVLDEQNKRLEKVANDQKK